MEKFWMLHVSDSEYLSKSLNGGLDKYSIHRFV